MRTMGIAELKALLSETIARVKGGEEVLVTENGQAVARVGPPSAASPAAATQDVGLIVRPPEKPLDETFWKLERPTYRVPPRRRCGEDGADEWELREAV